MTFVRLIYPDRGQVAEAWHRAVSSVKTQCGVTIGSVQAVTSERPENVCKRCEKIAQVKEAKR